MLYLKPYIGTWCGCLARHLSKDAFLLHPPIYNRVRHFIAEDQHGFMKVLADPSPPQPAQFFKSNFWQTPVAISKREQDLDMMPPPESSMVPMATRRPSVNMTSTNEMHSPPIHALKQEYIDENSQGSMVEHERYRHLSESSLDVHLGDSNISMITDNSMDMIHQNSMMSHMNENSNISVGNDDSVEMMMARRNSAGRHSMNNDDSVDIMTRRNSLTRQVSSVCESSLDCASSNMSMNDDSSCSTTVHPAVSDRSILQQHSGLLTAHATTTMENVMDLRMKMPMGTVADLVNTTAPSMAALKRFAIEHSSAPLPNQSGQSVENYLIKIEAKPAAIPMINPTSLLMKNDLSGKLTQVINNEQNVFQQQKLQAMAGQNCGMLSSAAQSVSHLGTGSRISKHEPVYLTSARPFLSSSTQNEVINIVAKSESAEIAEQTVPEQSNTMASSTITTIATALDRSVPTPINTERLDALVNSTVESHLSPTRTDSCSKDGLIKNTIPTVSCSNRPEVMMTSHDIMLNSQTNLMVPPMINTRMPSPTLGPQEITSSQSSPNLTTEVILNAQISPSLMCRNTNALHQETLLPASNLNICQSSTTVEPTLLASNINVPQQALIGPNSSQSSPESMSSLHSPISVTLTTEPEKAVLLKAAVDFLETQKKISELGSTLPSTTECDIICMTSPNNNSLNPLQTTGNSFVQSQFSTTCSTINSSVMCKDQKPDFIIPIPVKDISTAVQNDKKNEDRMIPQSFTALTENELINLINPSCFDQV